MMHCFHRQPGQGFSGGKDHTQASAASKPWLGVTLVVVSRVASPWMYLPLLADPVHRRRFHFGMLLRALRGSPELARYRSYGTTLCSRRCLFTQLKLRCRTDGALSSSRNRHRCPRRFVTFPTDGDTLAPRDCGYHCAARLFLRPCERVDGPGSCTSRGYPGVLRRRRWLDVTSPPPTRPQSGTLRVLAARSNQQYRAKPMIDQVPLGLPLLGQDGCTEGRP